MNRNRQKLTHRIIAEVKKRPFIWKRADPMYRNRVASFKAWIEMGKKIGVKPETVKFRWRSLRDIFQKEMKRIQKHLKDGGEPTNLRFWTYFRNLLFLKDEYDDPVRYPEIHLEEEEVEAEPEPVNVKDEFINCEDDYEIEALESVESWSEEVEDALAEPEVRVAPGPSHSKVKQFTIKESTQKPQEDANKPSQEDALDEDMLFVKSLVPYLKRIDPVRKLRLKGKIQNLIADELCND